MINRGNSRLENYRDIAYIHVHRIEDKLFVTVFLVLFLFMYFLDSFLIRGLH